MSLGSHEISSFKSYRNTEPVSVLVHPRVFTANARYELNNTLC